jgi:hypothetical protein
MTFSQEIECSSCQSMTEPPVLAWDSTAGSRRPAARLARVAHSSGGSGPLLAARSMSGITSVIWLLSSLAPARVGQQVRAGQSGVHGEPQDRDGDDAGEYQGGIQVGARPRDMDPSQYGGPMDHETVVAYLNRASHFTRTTICSRLTQGGRVSISGRMLIQTQRGTRTKQPLGADDVLLAAY